MNITVETLVNAPIEKVWSYWNEPKHITQWCNASDDWHAPFAETDLKVNGKFKTTMAAKDNSVSFDFEGVYTALVENSFIEYRIADGRMVSITFTAQPNGVNITETFEAEKMNTVELQQQGWQAILDNFKKYTES